jgi:hypothetical protein
MAVFSRRNGYNTVAIQLERASDTLKRRIMATFYKQEFDTYDTIEWTNYTTGIEDMMIEMGVPYEFPKNEIIKRKNAEALQRFVLESKEWYTIFDFVERYLAVSDENTSAKMANEFNHILEDEVSAYRILDRFVVPITNKAELATIEEAKSTPYDSVRTHVSKALALYADRKAPDYENSIKESISAVEAMCCIITGLTGAQATLGAAIKKLKDKGVHIHRAMETAFSSLYGYTSDENGIRHGGIDFKNAPAEDAKYMLISCSAFVNYLMEKWSKVQCAKQ